MTVTSSTESVPLLLPGIGAALVSALILIIAVLPAEFGIDPTGLGARLGLQNLVSATEFTMQAHQAQSANWQTDEVRLVLDPFASVEYKYPMTEGATIIYTWRASDELLFDLHAEEADADPEEATSFTGGRSRGANGSYTAPFTGIHGWFWENRTTGPVTLRLTSAGYINEGRLYEGGFAREVPLNQFAEQAASQ